MSRPKHRTAGYIDDAVLGALQSIVGDRLQILEDLYDRINEPGAGVSARRFRADHRHRRRDIEELERRSLIIKTFDGSQETYRASILVLALLKSDSAARIMAACDEILRYLSSEYLKRLDSQISVSEILNNVEGEPSVLRSAVFYLKGTPAVGGGATDFPANENSYTFLSEQLLDFDCLRALFAVMVEWALGRRLVAPESQEEALPQPPVLTTHAFDALFHQAIDGHWTSTLPTGIRELIGEVDQALKAGLTVVPALGIRAVIEMCCVDKVGRRDFLPKLLDEMVERGYLTPRSAASLNPVVELGNASAHAGYKPLPPDLETAVATTSALLNQLYNLDPRARELSERVPRKPRKGEEKEKSEARREDSSEA